MLSRLLSAALFVPILLTGSRTTAAPGKAEHVVLIVWDGMRPDFATLEYAPTLAALAQDGVVFRNHHAVFPSSTNVNGATLATGAYPQHHGIISNWEFRPEIEAHRAFDTSDFPALDNADGHINQGYLALPTIADFVQQAGYRTAIAGSKPVAQLFDRARRRESQAARDSVVIYRGKFLPASAADRVTAAIGAFPIRKSFPNDKEDAWTTSALTDVLWKNGVPRFSLLWLSEPDLSQHESGPGAPIALAAITSSDSNLAKVIAALKAKDALTSTDIFVVSDHGFSTIGAALDLAENLRAAGFNAVRALPDKPKPGQVLVVTLGGSTEFYVVGHEPGTVRRLIDYLQHSSFSGIIFTRTREEGTFTLAEAHLETPLAPDVLVAARWNSRPNKHGVPGEVAFDSGRGRGQGTHTTLSSFDMHNLLIASGPDFRRGWQDETPSGNTDLAPTILSLLGLQPASPLDGRVLSEALAGSTGSTTVAEKTLEAHRTMGNSVWRQHLRSATVNGVTYFLEGNGASSSGKP